MRGQELPGQCTWSEKLQSQGGCPAHFRKSKEAESLVPHGEHNHKAGASTLSRQCLRGSCPLKLFLGQQKLSFHFLDQPPRKALTRVRSLRYQEVKFQEMLALRGQSWALLEIFCPRNLTCVTLVLALLLEMGSFLFLKPVPFPHAHFTPTGTCALALLKLRLVLSTGSFHAHPHLLSRTPPFPSNLGSRGTLVSQVFCLYLNLHCGMG